MAFAPLAWVGAGLGLASYGPELVGKGDKNNNRQQQQPPPIYQIQTTPAGGFGVGSFMTAAVIGGGVVLFFGAYKYFFGRNPLDGILPELEAKTQETLEQVRKADENSRIRAQQIDDNNRQRLLQLQTEMQGEQRGNFEVLSEQINCLTQIALQTLTTITPNEQLALTSGSGEQQLAIQNQRTEVNEFAARAQEVADEIANPNYAEEKRQNASKRIRAKIPGANAITNSTQNRDMSGPNDLNGHRRGGRRNQESESSASYFGSIGRAVGLF